MQSFRLLPECEEYQRKLYLLFENIKEKGYWKTRCPLSGRCITFERSDEVLLAHQKWAAIHDMCFWCDRSIKK